ncbi:tubulin glycylase 3A-like isoform X3 [Diaphorina citri]|uniref:Tubulin glycylase 3A-like isoform X3 n=1 Tax=Diaphorina citri TaxID=121845 RepID=A0A3Q0JD51_DIACI|nr:tubulin glycylase 3A-like isoform X3 [Diaphorina citri]
MQLRPATPRGSKQRDGHEKDERSRKLEHYQDYNFLNYISEMTDYVRRKRRMLDIGYTMDMSRRNILNMKVKEAVEKNMIFAILGYYPAVRHKLVNMGWVEKIDSKRTYTDFTLRKEFMLTNLDSAPYIIKNEKPEQVTSQYYEQKYMSDALAERKPDLLFALRKNYITWSALEPDTVVSYFPKCNFCSKLGLNICLESTPVFKNDSDSLKYPRGFNMSNEISMRRFVQNFRETSCFSLMRYVKYCFEKHKPVYSLDGAIPWKTFDFAEAVCLRRIKALQLEFVEGNTLDRYQIEEPEDVTQAWTEFGQDVYNLSNQRATFKFIGEDEMQHVFARAKHVVESVEEYNKQEMYDGTHNVWVLKPVANCSGHGIRIYRQLEDIKRAIGTLKNLTCPRCVVQKYIEKPLLIHGVKFDLRVWYVITNIDKFKIWVYHEGYVRFCSKPYSNILLDEARHLTNVRIQKQYRNVRDPPQLPAELMWDFKQLRDYFTKNMNLPRKWDMIMKAMEESIVTIMRCAQSINYIDLRKNSFQLFGADFLIHENYQPCLIEVNNGPGLSPTTSIIAKKTTELLTDMVKVVTAERNPLSSFQNSVDTGKFHLIYCKELGLSQATDKERLTQAMKTTQVDLLEWKKAVRVWKLHKTATHKSRKTI